MEVKWIKNLSSRFSSFFEILKSSISPYLEQRERISSLAEETRSQEASSNLINTARVALNSLM